MPSAEEAAAREPAGIPSTARTTPNTRTPPARQVAELLLRSLAERRAYDQPDFCARLDAYLGALDGSPYCVAGGRTSYTDVAMRDLWRARKAGAEREGGGWGRADRGWSLGSLAGCGDHPAAHRLPSPQVDGRAWGEGASCSDTAEGAIRAVMLAAR